MIPEYMQFYYKEAWGEDEKQFFLRRAEPFCAACADCKGTLNVVRTETTVHAVAGSTAICPNCSGFCQLWSGFTTRWFNTVDRRYQQFWSVKSLTPLNDRQASMVRLVQDNPNKSFAFFGPHGLGKTVMCTALYAQALWRELLKSHNLLKQQDDASLRAGLVSRNVVRINTKALLDQFTDWNMHHNDSEATVKRPAIYRERIQYHTQVGRRTTLYLEELDKVRETEARHANLFSVLDALDGAADRGQLLVNFNCRFAELEPDIGRRIAQMCSGDLGFMVDLHE